MQKECKKVKFATESFALEWIEKLKKTSVRETVPIRAYLCTWCSSWHLTSKKDRQVIHLEEQIQNLKDKMSLQAEEHAKQVAKLEEELKKKNTKIENHKMLLKQQHDLISRLRQRIGYIK